MTSPFGLGGGCPTADAPHLNSEQNPEYILDLVKTAVAEKSVLLAYQPVMQANDPDTPAFYEGLLRIVDPDRNIIAAKDFIDLVETDETGRIIDCLALELCLKTLTENPDLRVSVNMSARSIGYRRWMKVLNARLAQSPGIAKRLIIEITESSAMVMPDVVNYFMAGLRKKGITFALDDFGSGFTAFRYFRQFQFDIVKIDGQFIRGIDRNADNQVLTKALVAIAQQFDMYTVAECVESAEELKFLQSIGIDCVQGYLLDRPQIHPVWPDGEIELADYPIHQSA